MRKIPLLALILPVLICFAADLPFFSQKKNFHSIAEYEVFQKIMNRSAEGKLYFKPDTAGGGHFLPIDSSTMWPTSNTCKGCHSYDSLGFALITTSGVDVNVYDDWSSTMMANAAKDPFWRAKVSHEIWVNPAHSTALQDKCTSCHAPAGHFQKTIKEQQAHYSIAQMLTDSLGLDGVTCQVCHAMGKENLGFLHSGNLTYDTNKVRIAYGPYEFIQAGPMHDFVGITPKYTEHIAEAGLCAGCHTLLTESVDLQGNLTGTTFTEQATYHEWLNSIYDASHQNLTCQKCHMPQLADEIIIATNYQFLTPKSPYGLHELAGANSFMLKLLKNNKSALGIPATNVSFDSTIAATMRQLQHKTLDLSVKAERLDGDTINIAVEMVNKAGHKFPSGYPSRRAWVEFTVRKPDGTPIFHSGAINSDFTLRHEDPNFEPHYNTISDSTQVQIYEITAGDVNGQFTSVLERAYTTLKDNRLCPKGFLKADPAYDTTAIVGAAGTDADFNHDPLGVEGSGSDILHFKVLNPGYSGPIVVDAKIWYQSIPPRWLEELFAVTTPEIDSFKAMYTAADKSPVLVASATLDTVITTVGLHGPLATENTAIRIFPTITKSGKVHIELGKGAVLEQVRVFSLDGTPVWNQKTMDIVLPNKNQVYIVSVKTRDATKTVKVFYSE